MHSSVLKVHGGHPASGPTSPLVLDSPHSGFQMPDDFGSVLSATTTSIEGVDGLPRAYADPARGRHSLQLEVNKRLYMHGDRIATHDGFASLQAHLMQLLDAISLQFQPRATHG